MRNAALTAALVAAASGACTRLAEGHAAGREAATQLRPAGSATVTVDAAHPRGAIPTRFLGLSFEARELPAIGRLASRGDLAALLRSLGPGVLRFGGNSVDATTAWVDAARPTPRWARVTISAADLDGIARLARASDWSVLLAVTLGHPDAGAAAREVAAARARLGSLLAGVEIGNEPDQYVRKQLRHRPWGYDRYRRQVAAYRAAIARAAPGVPLAGPDLADAKPSRWLSVYARQQRPALLTAHFYPLIRCGHDRPTIAKLLNPSLGASEQRILDRLAGLAARARRPLRLGETNNVACSGEPGVSDRFASALWALDYLVRIVDAGIRGVNFHGFVGECRTYTPFCAHGGAALAAGRLTASPEWYALLAARSFAGGRPLRTTVAPATAGLTTLALSTSGGGIDVVLVNVTAHPVQIAVRLPRQFGSVSVLRLTAPSVRARAGVRLGGVAVGADGGWDGHAQRVDSPDLTLSGSSAAVVSAR